MIAFLTPLTRRQVFAVFRLMQRARLRHPSIATNAARKIGQACVELVDVAVGPASDLPIGVDAELLQQALKHRPDSDDQLEIVRRSGTVEQERRRIVFEIDQKLTIARGFVA